MKKSLISLALAAACGFAQAGLVASDNFDTYTGGLSGENGGSGWAGAWAAEPQTTVVAVTAGAAPAGDSPMSGNAISFAPAAANAAAQRTLSTAVNAAAVAVEIMFQFDGGDVGTNDFLALWFGSTAGPNIGLKANCGDGSCPTGTDQAGADLFVRPSGMSNNDAAYSTNITVGQTYRLLGLLEKSSLAGNYDKFSLWVDPTAQERSQLTGADASFSGNTGISSFSTIGFRTATFSGNDRFLVDNLSISVVPEPASLALVGLALAGAGIASRRRKG
jgi:hypothetical protein